MTVPVGQVGYLASEEDKIRWLALGRSRQCEEAELGCVMDRRKDELLVLKGEEGHEYSPVDNVAKEDIGRVIGSDTGREDHSFATVGPGNRSHHFGKGGVRVDVPSASQGIE